MSRIEDVHTFRGSANHLGTGRCDKKDDTDHLINYVSRFDSGDLHTNHNHENICDSSHQEHDIYRAELC